MPTHLCNTNFPSHRLDWSVFHCLILLSCLPRSIFRTYSALVGRRPGLPEINNTLIGFNTSYHHINISVLLFHPITYAHCFQQCFKPLSWQQFLANFFYIFFLYFPLRPNVSLVSSHLSFNKPFQYFPFSLHSSQDDFSFLFPERFIMFVSLLFLVRTLLCGVPFSPQHLKFAVLLSIHFRNLSKTVFFLLQGFSSSANRLCHHFSLNFVSQGTCEKFFVAKIFYTRLLLDSSANIFGNLFPEYVESGQKHRREQNHDPSGNK